MFFVGKKIEANVVHDCMPLRIVGDIEKKNQAERETRRNE